MTTAIKEKKHKIELNGRTLKQLKNFNYFGRVLWENKLRNKENRQSQKIIQHTQK